MSDPRTPPAGRQRSCKSILQVIRAYLQGFVGFVGFVQGLLPIMAKPATLDVLLVSSEAEVQQENVMG